MDKRNKHITINLTNDEYNYIIQLSKIYRRSVSEMAYLILIDNAIDLFLKNQKQGINKPAVFVPGSFE